ncbi:unnamed protein product [Caenorhabditis sp. 36 PRJEB53466]|nr:unnamed protein product [Caenorhabditis sp. 36 PRJEB53466]
MLPVFWFLLVHPVISEIAENDDDSWKELTFSLRADTVPIKKKKKKKKKGLTIIEWTDRFDDSFAYAYTNENRSDLKFLYDKPRPELFTSPKFISEAFTQFLDFFQNRTKIEKIGVSLPSMTDDLRKFNSYDSRLYTEFLRLSSGIPKQMKISFFSFPERTEHVLNGTILYHPKIRKVGELDLRTLESDISDAQLHQLECESVYIRSSTVTNAGINRILKEWQDGFRPTKHLKVVSDDVQKAEIMDGVSKRTLQRGVWEIKNRFNVSATVSVSRVTTNLFDSKPTFEFAVS